jgi:hypothetical protein
MLEVRLPAEPSALFLARAAVVAVSSGLPKSVVSDVELLTSEVVANAILHANSDLHATVIVRVERGDSVRVEVVDQGPAFGANPRESGPGSDGGWDGSWSTPSPPPGASNPKGLARRFGSNWAREFRTRRTASRWRSRGTLEPNPDDRDAGHFPERTWWNPTKA